MQPEYMVRWSGDRLSSQYSDGSVFADVLRAACPRGRGALDVHSNKILRALMREEVSSRTLLGGLCELGLSVGTLTCGRSVAR